MKRRNDSGIALVTSILMLALMSALLVGAVTLAISEQKSRFQDKDRTVAFEASHGGLEKLTNDLGDLFNRNYAPTQTQVDTLRNGIPSLGGAVFSLKGNSDPKSGYKITKGPEETGRKINEGPYEGLFANITPYTVSVTARTPTESEVTLERTVNTVAIPVFQFGIFSETDLSYFPGPTFNFGGRVHTNGNLFLAKGNSGKLILGDRVTAFKEIVRKYLANGHPTSDNYQGEVRVLTTSGGCATAAQIAATTAPYDCRPMADTEGSVVGDENSAANTSWPGPTGISNGTNAMPTNYYASNILTHPDAKKLNLPLASGTAKPIDLIRRPAVGEKAAANDVYSQRYYQYASLRILLSDTSADISTLDDSATPVQLSTLSSLATNVQQGWISIMMQGAPPAGATNGTWSDVTTEILGKGLGGRNPLASCDSSADPYPDAIIRLQRIKNTGAACGSTTATDYWPNALYDAREGRIRDTRDDPVDGSNFYVYKVHRGGVMYYVELDVRNLRKWFQAKGANIMQETGGFVVYFSDRRGNHDWANSNKETGELGFEDVVNSGAADGTSAGVNSLDVGEDVNASTTLQTYGGFNSGGTLTYWDQMDPTTAQNTPATLFRRALKLVHGNRIDMVTTTETFTKGLTIASENPVYIHGDYNALITEDPTTGDEWLDTYDKPHIASAVIADAVTLLSNGWRDNQSFSDSHNLASANHTSYNNPAGSQGAPWYYKTTRIPTSVGAVYRTAIIAGKSLTFPKPSWTTVRDLGTDGGTHNFLRYLEEWSNIPIWYRGSMVSFYTSRQAVGIFKCCTVVYGAPVRHYSFDEDFKDTNKLPPRTPVVRDVNTTTFTKKSGPPTS